MPRSWTASHPTVITNALLTAFNLICGVRVRPAAKTEALTLAREAGMTSC